MDFLIGLNWLYWFLPSFNEFYWILPGFYLVLLVFTVFFCKLVSTDFCWAFQVYTASNLVLLGFPGFYLTITGLLLSYY